MKFKRYRIADLLDEISMGPFGSNIKKECFVKTGVPVLNGSNLTGIALNDDEFRYVTEEKADSLGKANAHRSDVVVTHRGTLGQISFIPETSKYERYVISQSQFRFRCNEKVLPEYLTYYFHTRKGQYDLLSNASQVGVPALARATTTFQQLEVEIPDIVEQHKIVEIFENFRKKMEINIKINNNLEHQARTIYNAWFVELEPFNGKIPSDWIVSKLGDIASIKTNSFVPAKNSDAQLEHYSIPAYDDQKYPVFESATGVKSNKYILTSNSVMISKLNPETKRVWRPMCLSGLAVSSTEFIIFEAFNPKYRDFVFSIIDSVSFSDWMCAHTTGSTNSRQRTAPNTTLEFQFVLPDEKAIMDFCAIVTPMYDAIAANICENQKFAQLRNAILPKLMSGELDVSNIKL